MSKRVCEIHCWNHYLIDGAINSDSLAEDARCVRVRRACESDYRFSVLSNEGSSKDARVVAERLRQRLCQRGIRFDEKRSRNWMLCPHTDKEFSTMRAEIGDNRWLWQQRTEERMSSRSPDAKTSEK